MPRLRWILTTDKKQVCYCRQFNRRGTFTTLAAVVASVSANAVGAYQFWFRFPGIPELLSNRWILCYVALSFLLGMAVSYYFDNHDEKLIDILCTGLRLLGMAMVFYSFSQVWEVAAVAVCILTLAVALILPSWKRAPTLDRIAGVNFVLLHTVNSWEYWDVRIHREITLMLQEL
jgi:hypothetical protein